MSAAFPALATATYGIRLIGDFESIHRRAERTHRVLDKLITAIEKDDPADIGSCCAPARARRRTPCSAMCQAGACRPKAAGCRSRRVRLRQLVEPFAKSLQAHRDADAFFRRLEDDEGGGLAGAQLLQAGFRPSALRRRSRSAGSARSRRGRHRPCRSSARGPEGSSTPSGASTRISRLFWSAVLSTMTVSPTLGRSSAVTLWIRAHCSPCAPGGVSQRICQSPCTDFTVPCA